MKTVSSESDSGNTTKENDDSFKIKAGLFFAGLAGVSALIGFGSTLAASRKQDPKYFTKGMTGSLEMAETGTSLAMRALGWGTLYAFTGCGILTYCIWKLSGAQTFEEFRYKAGNILPRIPKNDPPQGRTEFSGLNDLLGYLATLKSAKDK